MSTKARIKDYQNKCGCNMMFKFIILSFFFQTSLFAQPKEASLFTRGQDHSFERFFDVSQSKCGGAKSSIDLRQKGNSMYGIPVLDQNGIACCYAYSAAVMVSAWLNSKLPVGVNKIDRAKKTLSPFIACETTTVYGVKEDDKEECNNAHICHVANSLKKMGGCYANTVLFKKNGLKNWIDRPTEAQSCDRCVRWESGGELEVINNRIKQFQMLGNQVSTNLSYSEKEKARLLMAETDKIDSLIYSAHGSLARDTKKMSISSALTMPSTFPVLAPLCIKKEKDGKIIYYGNRQILPSESFKCDYKISKDAIENGYCGIKGKGSSQKDFLDFINDEFDNNSNPQPIGIDYCWAFLLEGFKGILKSRRLSDGFCLLNGKDKPDHKSLIIGRRWSKQKNRCEYLLRNSWGNDCGSYFYDKNLSISHDDNMFYSSCIKELKRTGYADVWIPAAALLLNTDGVSKLRK